MMNIIVQKSHLMLGGKKITVGLPSIENVKLPWWKESCD